MAADAPDGTTPHLLVLAVQSLSLPHLKPVKNPKVVETLQVTVAIRIRVTAHSQYGTQT